MKTLIKSLALALTLGIATSAASFAETNPGSRPASVVTYKTGIYSTQKGQLSIALDKEPGGAVDISLKSTDGKTLFTRHLGKHESQYRTRLDLSDLPDGVYQVAITNGAETTTRNVTIATQKPEMPGRVVVLN